MKIIASIIVLLAVIVCAYFAYLSMNETAPDTALVDNKLRPCPDTPNCVSSETTGEQFIEPFKSTATIQLDDLWEDTLKAITEQGGEVEAEEDGYLWATFQSKLFKFTDDLELRRDDEAGVIHVRSASRSGHSDMGVNRKRVEALRLK